MEAVTRQYSRIRYCVMALVALAGTAGASTANAQASLAEFSEQRLDRVDVIFATGADNIYVDTTKASKPWMQKPYTASGTSLSVCQNTGTRGLYCLDGNKIVNWANPESQTTGTELYNCGNTAVFDFDRDNVCTALTVDLGGNVWIAGKKKSKFSLFKVSERAAASASCANEYPAALPGPVAFIGLNGKAYCAREYASGRPLLVDLNVIDGDTAEGFPYSEGGVIGVEERKEVTFFRDVPKATPWVVGAGRDWGLTSGEQLQGASILQRYFPSGLGNPLELTRNWILVTTSRGRLLSREMPVTAGATNTNPVLNHSAGQVNLIAPLAVTGAASVYDVRTSVKTRSVFVSDQRGGRVLSLKSNVEGVNRTQLLAFDPSLQQLVASTTASATDSDTLARLATFPQAISIAPGIEVNLRDDCGGFDSAGQPKACPIVGDSGNDTNLIPAAQLKNVTIDVGTPAGLTVFQIQNIPDCRYIKYSLQPAECKAGAILTAGGTPVTASTPHLYDADGYPLTPEMLFLDVKPLLPPEVTSIKTLPRMLISPRYKALERRGNVFDALFGVTDAGVRFRDNFLAEFYLDDLLGKDPVGDFYKLGCGGNSELNPDPGSVWSTDGPQWDVLLTISENYTTVGGLPGGGFQHTDMLVNKDTCVPEDPPAAGTRWSMYAYGMQLAKERVPSRTAPASVETRYSDSIFARLVLSQFNDLGATIDTYLCVDRDGGSGPPATAQACNNLQGAFPIVLDKLVKCVESSTEPLNSTEIRACNAFEVQYEPFKATIDALVRSPSATDPANRVGEVKARLEVFRYVYDRQFKPSIPPNTGFLDPL